MIHHLKIQFFAFSDDERALVAKRDRVDGPVEDANNFETTFAI
jgi:hypothetical protein